MTAELHALPGLAQTDPDLPKVTLDIDDSQYRVDVDFTDLVDLQAFFRLVGADPDLRWAVQNLMLNKGTSQASRDLRTAGAARLRKATRIAFTAKLQPEQAERLHEELAAAALEPMRCEAEDCGWYVQEDDDRLCIDAWSGRVLCPHHLAIVQGG